MVKSEFRLTANGTNPGIFRSNVSTFLLSEPKCTEFDLKRSRIYPSQNILKLDLKKARICPIWVNLIDFGPKSATDISASGNLGMWIALVYIYVKDIRGVRGRQHWYKMTPSCQYSWAGRTENLVTIVLKLLDLSYSVPKDQSEVPARLEE